MELKQIKEFLDLKGLMQDGLFALGSIPNKSAHDFGHALGAIYGGSIAKLYAFTFLEGALTITPITDTEVLIGEAIRIMKNDVNKITLKSKLFGKSLKIIFKDNKERVYNLEKTGNIQEILDKVNSYKKQ